MQGVLVHPSATISVDFLKLASRDKIGAQPPSACIFLTLRPRGVFPYMLTSRWSVCWHVGSIAELLTHNFVAWPQQFVSRFSLFTLNLFAAAPMERRTSARPARALVFRRRTERLAHHAGNLDALETKLKCFTSSVKKRLPQTTLTSGLCYFLQIFVPEPIKLSKQLDHHDRRLCRFACFIVLCFSPTAVQ